MQNQRLVDASYFVPKKGLLLGILCRPKEQARVIALDYNFDSLFLFFTDPAIVREYDSGLCIVAQNGYAFNQRRFENGRLDSYIVSGYKGTLVNRILANDEDEFSGVLRDDTEIVFGDFLILQLSKKDRKFRNPKEWDLAFYSELYRNYHQFLLSQDGRNIFVRPMEEYGYHSKTNIGFERAYSH